MVSTWALTLGAGVAFEAHGYVARILKDSGPLGSLAPILLTIVAGLGVADSLVNDLLPPRFRLFTRSYRYVGFPAMSIILALMCAPIAIAAGLTFALPMFIAPSIFAFAITFLDIFSRRRSSSS